MRNIIILILLAPMLHGCSEAPAANPTATVSWTNPSANTDGSAFNPATDQKATSIQWGTSHGGPYPNAASAQGAASSLQVPMLASCGTFYFVASTVANDGTASAPSAEASVRYPCAPNAPTNLAVQ